LKGAVEEKELKKAEKEKEEFKGAVKGQE